MGCSSWVLLSTSPPPYTFSLALLSHKVSEVFLLLGFLWFVLLKLCLPAQLLLSLLLYINSSSTCRSSLTSTFSPSLWFRGTALWFPNMGKQMLWKLWGLVPNTYFTLSKEFVMAKNVSKWAGSAYLKLFLCCLKYWELIFWKVWLIFPFKSFQRAGYLKG